MSIQDSLKNAADDAKWKADQQIRIIQTQGTINTKKNLILTQKALLADEALNCLNLNHLLNKG